MPDPSPQQTGYVKPGKKIRARIRHAAFTRMPVQLTRGRLRTMPGVNNFCCVDRDIHLPNLPTALDGFTITHLSDLHVGDLLTPDRLPEIIEAANSLGGDMVAVTGDLIDLSIRPLDQVLDALHQLESPLGTFVVPGNHDYLDDGVAFLKALEDSQLSLLINNAQTIKHNGAEILLAGIDYAAKDNAFRKLIDQAIDGAPDLHDDQLRILLAHHPNAFDMAQSRDMHLTLSGHTHGGQVVLRQRKGDRGPVSVGRLGCKYSAGLYGCNQGHQLHVTTGVGSWFPWRVRCPAEIVRLTLRRGWPNG